MKVPRQRKHKISTSRTAIHVPKGFKREHDPEAIPKYIKEFNRLNNLKDAA